jgi:hypothetical protein
MRTVLAALAALALGACGKKEEAAAPPAPPAPKKERPAKLPNGEPAVVTVKHVLIAIAGSADRREKKRTPADAEKEAYGVIARARAGEDFEKLMTELSDDNPLGGTYTLVNLGVDPEPGEMTRAGMVKGFGDVSFKIEVGEVNLADYHPQHSPYGYHVIKRVK